MRIRIPLPRTIACFSDCVGFDRSWLVYHLAHMLVDMGERVVLVDTDPQCRLTSLCLPEEQLEQLWSGRDDEHRTLFGAVSTAVRGVNKFDATPIEFIRDGLALLAGDPGLNTLEEPLEDAWQRTLNGDAVAFRSMFALRCAFDNVVFDFKATILLIDMGSNLSALNRAIACNVDHFVIPIAPEIRSLYGLRHMGHTIAHWKKARDLRITHEPTNTAFAISHAPMLPMGYVIVNASGAVSRAPLSSDKWLWSIPTEYRRSILQDDSIAPNPAKDQHCLATLRNHQSLTPLARDAQKPIFHLLPADGAIGAHMTAVRRCRKDFEQFAKTILERTQSGT